jgi:hypothetical protein
MIFLIYPLLAIFGIKKATEDEPLSMTMLSSLLSWLCCSFMVAYGASKSPVKTPPVLMAMLVCCCCSSSATSSLVNDTMKRVKKLSA